MLPTPEPTSKMRGSEVNSSSFNSKNDDDDDDEEEEEEEEDGVVVVVVVVVVVEEEGIEVDRDDSSESNIDVEVVDRSDSRMFVLCRFAFGCKLSGIWMDERSSGNSRVIQWRSLKKRSPLAL